MATPNQKSFTGSKYSDSMVLLDRNTADATLINHVPVAVAATGEGGDATLIALPGVMRMGAGDAIHLLFAKSGTVSTPTFMINRWRPYAGTDGNIAGYVSTPLTDKDCTITYGAIAIGTALATIGTPFESAPATAPAGTEVWATSVSVRCNNVVVDRTVSTDGIINNIDIINNEDGPVTVRITPFDGDTHIQVLQKTGGGGGVMLCFAYRGRGLALNRP